MKIPLSLLASTLLAASVTPAAGDALELRTAKGHPMQYLVSRPRGWTAGRTWPVLVVVPDAARQFRANAQAFVDARGDAPFVIVAPFVLTCGGSGFPRTPPTYGYAPEVWKDVDAKGPYRFDEEGLRAVIDDVRERDHGESRVFLTGWEAGGHTVWALTFNHPEWLRASAPVSPNWLGRWVKDETAAADRPPVRVLFCGRPPSGDLRAGWDHLREQTQAAVAEARARGFADVTLADRPGRPHGPLAADVIETFAAMLNAGEPALGIEPGRP